MLSHEQGEGPLQELLEHWSRDKAYHHFTLEKKDFHEKRAEMVRSFGAWTDFHERRDETIQVILTFGYNHSAIHTIAGYVLQ
jgi:hypothetical protein